MTRGRVLDRIERALPWGALTALAAAAVGWAADQIGILPPAAEPFPRPLLVAGGLAVAAGEGMRMGRELIRRALLRWTCTAAAVAGAVLIAVQAGALVDVWPEDSPLAFTVVFATVPIVAAGLFADAVVLRRSGVPRLGPVGAAAGGVGLLALTAGTLTAASWAFFASLPLLAFAGFAFFHVRGRMRAELPGPVEGAAVRVPASPFKWPGHRR
ncbi:MAG TPA: hypothetical protein VGO40_02975 [Longimicrobium sp.]|jgi:hypothetical protein|nr:hypothetical protein [Longimicrobium sp.]